jgi:uncharacterized protein GlcG (DUF336 family)
MRFATRLTIGTPTAVALTAVVLTALVLAAPVRAQGVLMVREVSVDMAHAMVAAGLARCRQDKFKVSIAVVGRDGHLLAFLREDGANQHTVELATRKAYTSRVFRQTSREFAQRLLDNPQSAGLRDTTGVMASIGGLPIKVGGEVIGGIGVSGAPGGQNDEACAQAGLDKVADQLK